MKRIVVYGSKYGTTKMYADELAKRLGVEAVSYKEIMNLDSYDSIIYLGGVYASGVLGMILFQKLVILMVRNCF